MFSADVRPEDSSAFVDLSRIAGLIGFRKEDLGQYIFIRARNVREANVKKPSWLYRSYAPDDLC